MPTLANDTTHFNYTSERWGKRLNRPETVDPYPDEWYASQCLMCLYYIPLSGVFAYDWGACSNRDSDFDGMVRFEHDGCDHFDYDAEYDNDEDEDVENRSPE